MGAQAWGTVGTPGEGRNWVKPKGVSFRLSNSKTAKWDSVFSVSALFKSMTGMEVQTTVDKAKCNGVRKSSSFSSSSSLASNRGKLRRLSGSRRNSFRQLGRLFSRTTTGLPGLNPGPAHSTSDGLSQPAAVLQDHSHIATEQVTHSEMHLNQMGLDTQSNGQGTLPPSPLPPLGLPPSLHCASSFTASNVRLYNSNDVVSEGCSGPSDGQDTSFIWEDQEDCITTHL